MPTSFVLIAYCRLTLAVFGLIAIYLNEDQLSLYPTLTYQLLVAFLVYAVLLLPAERLRLIPRGGAMVVQALDLAFFAFLALATEEPTSPLLVYFTFALFSATLQWGWRGAVSAALVTVAIYWAIAGLWAGDFEDAAFLLAIRGGYQLAAGMMFAYFGWALDLQRRRLSALAAWPSSDSPGPAREQPDLDTMLRHVSVVTGATQVTVVWDDAYEPHTHFVRLSGGTVERGTVQPVAGSETDEEQRLFAALPADVAASIRRAGSLSVPFDNEMSGLLILSGVGETEHELRPIAEIAALQIGTEIIRQAVARRAIELAQRDGWNRLARDIHDGLLQSLAATSIRLVRLEGEASPGQLATIAEVNAALWEQQASLRQLLAGDRGQGAHDLVDLRQLMLGEIEALSRQWQTAIAFQPGFLPFPVDLTLARSLLLFVREAVANGIRHGGADNFDVSISSTGKTLLLIVAHDGKGLAGIAGEFEHERIMAEGLGSGSLRRRAELMGGRLRLTTDETGLVVSLVVDLT